MNRFVPFLKTWIIFATSMTLVCGIIYVTVQQNYRLSANDPQLQLAGDAAVALSKGADPKTLAGSQSVEISESLSAYLVIYDTAGHQLASGANLNGIPLRIPAGVITYVTKNGKDAATWQPAPGVRQAMVGVLSPGQHRFIAFSGRSLSIVEERINLLRKQVLLGWIVSLIGIAFVQFLLNAIETKFRISENL